MLDRGKSGWQVEESAGLAALEALRPEWEALWQTIEPPLAFQHPAWLLAQAASLDDPRQVRTWSVRHEGQLVVLLPLVAERAWVCGVWARRWRNALSVHDFPYEVPSAPGERGLQAVRHLADKLLARGGWDVLELRDVVPGGAAEALLQQLGASGGRPRRWEARQSPYVDLTQGDGMQGTRPPFRTHLRRTRRRLLENGGTLQLRRASTVPATLGLEVEAFYRLEAAGWKGRAGTAIAQRPRARRFFDLAATTTARLGWLVLHRLEFNEQLIAMSYSLAAAGRYEVIKWSYAENFARFGPGHLLIEEMIRECLHPPTGPALGYLCFNGANDEHKRKWTQTCMPLEFQFAFAPTPRGRLLGLLKARSTEAMGKS